jgi:hypothetical protein
MAKSWRPRTGEYVRYFDDYDRTWKRGKVCSYESHYDVRIYLANGIACGVFRVSELRPILTGQ